MILRYRRATACIGWKVIEMEGSHNPHWFQPENFVAVLLQVIDE